MRLCATVLLMFCGCSAPAPEPAAPPPKPAAPATGIGEVGAPLRLPLADLGRGCTPRCRRAASTRPGVKSASLLDCVPDGSHVAGAGGENWISGTSGRLQTQDIDATMLARIVDDRHAEYSLQARLVDAR